MSSTQINQTWIEHPSNTTVATVGDIVLLRCRVKNPAGKVVWYKGKEHLFQNNRTDPNSRITNFPRHRYIGDEASGENDLEIIKIRTEDAGQYKCHAVAPGRNKHKDLSWYAEVIVTPQELASPLMNHQLQSIPPSLPTTAALFDGTPANRAAATNRNFVRLAPSNAQLNASPVIAMWLYVILVIVAGLLLATNAYLLFSLRKRRKKSLVLREMKAEEEKNNHKLQEE